MNSSEIVKLTISELAPKIKSREISPVEVTEAALDQANRFQPRLNSFITLLLEQAMSQAREQEAALMRAAARHTHRHQGQPSHGRHPHHRWL